MTNINPNANANSIADANINASSNPNLKNKFFSSLDSIKFAQNFYQQFISGLKTIFAIFSKNSSKDDSDYTNIISSEIDEAIKNNLVVYDKLSELVDMQCHEQIKENMQEFAVSAEALNLKVSDNIMPDINAALKAINFSESTPQNEEIAEYLYNKVLHKTQELYYNERNFIKKNKDRFNFIEEFRKSNKVYIENNVCIKEHIKIEEDFEKYLESEKDVFFTYLSSLLETSLEFIVQKEKLLINSYNNMIKKGFKVFDVKERAKYLNAPANANAPTPTTDTNATDASPANTTAASAAAAHANTTARANAIITKVGTTTAPALTSTPETTTTAASATNANTTAASAAAAHAKTTARANAIITQARTNSHHNQDELSELLEKITIAKKDSQILAARAEYAKILLFSEEMVLQEQDTKHKIILTKKQIAIQKKNNALERKEIQEINAQTRMIRAQTFAIKAKDEAAKLFMERAKVDVCRAKASIAQTRVKAQEQKTLAAQAREQEMSIKLEQTKALQAFIKSKIEMKSIQESIKEVKATGVIAALEGVSAVGEVMVI